MSTGVAVSVQDVFVAFPGGAGPVMALRGSDLTVAAGERLVVEGPNGSGKTTLLRVITGEQPVTAGRVEVGGTALHRLTRSERRRWRARTVGFVDQHARRNLLPELGVLDNVALQLSLTGTSRREARTAARTALDRLDLGGWADTRVAELSGGDAQRVAICAAVAHRPALVLADEPTGELDDAAAAEAYGLLSRIAGDGTSLVMVCHDARARAWADHGVRVRDGRVAEEWRGHPDQVRPVPDSRGWVRPPGQPATESAILPRTHRAAPDPAGVVLEATGLTTGYPGRVLRAGLDLTVGPGRWVAVAGRSGTGKTTLLSTLAGLLDPRAGTVRVGGQDLDGLDRAGRAELRRRHLAVLPQSPALLEPLTVTENLELAAATREAPVDVPGLLADLVLTPLADQQAGTLSGGERQRLGLARVLASRAPVLVLDEPTSQQDEASAARVVAVLRRAAADGQAVLVASHDPRCLSPADHTVRLG